MSEFNVEDIQRLFNEAPEEIQAEPFSVLDDNVLMALWAETTKELALRHPNPAAAMQSIFLITALFYFANDEGELTSTLHPRHAQLEATIKRNRAMFLQWKELNEMPTVEREHENE